MLNENNIHVADTYYGWRDMGDYTDTVDWPRWFNDDVMPIVYSEMGTETASNTIAPGMERTQLLCLSHASLIVMWVTL